MSDEVTSLINQAKDQARRENIKNFFGKNAKLLSRLTIIVLILVVAALGLSAIQKSRQAKYSEIFHQSLISEQLGDEAKARAELQQIYDAKFAPSGVRSLASLRLAAIYFNEGKVKEANKIYSEISDCSSCDRYIRDLAGLLLVKSWLAEESEINKDDLSARIEKVENSNKVLKFHIAEQRAFLEAQKGDFEKAYKILELIVKSPESSPALKERAKDAMQILVSKGFEVKEEEKTEEQK